MTTDDAVTSGAVRPGSDVLRRAALTGAVAAVGSAVAAVVVATVAKAVGVQHASQLQPGPLAFLTIVGVAIGTTVWVLVSRRADDPVALLRRLVPIVLVLSFVPDLLVGLGSDSWGAAVSLALAHVSVFAVTISVLQLRLGPTSLRAPRQG